VGDGTSREKKFNLGKHSWKEYRSTRPSLCNGQQALVIERWLNQAEEDASGLIFEEWDPTRDADTSQPLVAMLINSSELRTAGYTLKEVIPPALEAAARDSRRRYGAGLSQLQNMGPKKFVLSVDNNNELRSRCKRICGKSHCCCPTVTKYG